jgi:hypothetical protein
VARNQQEHARKEGTAIVTNPYIRQGRIKCSASPRFYSFVILSVFMTLNLFKMEKELISFISSSPLAPFQ